MSERFSSKADKAYCTGRYKWWHGTTIAFTLILAIPIINELTEWLDHPLWEAAWIASWGFLFGSAYQDIRTERNNECEKKLLEQIKAEKQHDAPSQK